MRRKKRRQQHARCSCTSDAESFMRDIASRWRYPESARETRPGLWVFATGGWSGNERLLDELYESKHWSLLSWHSLYVPGGLQIVAVSDAAAQELDELRKKIIRWAWRKREK